MLRRKKCGRLTIEETGMNEEILEDIRLLLIDCGKQFRKFQRIEAEKCEGTASLVERSQAVADADVYAHVAAACEKYSALCVPDVETR